MRQPRTTLPSTAFPRMPLSPGVRALLLGVLGSWLLPPTEIGQKPLLASRIRSGDHLGPIMAKVSMGPDQSSGRDQTDPPELISTEVPSTVQGTQIPPVTEGIDQVDAGGRLRIEVSERQAAHPAAVYRYPGPLHRCDGRAKRTRRISSDKVALRQLRPVSLAGSEPGKPQGYRD